MSLIKKIERDDTYDASAVSAWMNHFQEQGYVILKSVISREAVDSAKRGCTELLDDLASRLLSEGKVDSLFQDASFEDRISVLCASCKDKMPNLFRHELHKEEFFELLCGQALLDIVQRLLPTAERFRIYPNYSCRPKTKSKLHAVTWHQDAGLRADGGPSTAPEEERLDAFGKGRVVNCWTPLVEATRENGAMKFIRASHKKLLPHAVIGSYRGSTGSGAQLPETPGSDHAAIAATPQSVPAGTYMTGIENLDPKDKAAAIDVECSPGDVVLFSNLLVHRGGINRTEKTRWSFDWRFQDASKPTHRAESGHVVFENGKRAIDASNWASLELS